MMLMVVSVVMLFLVLVVMMMMRILKTLVMMRENLVNGDGIGIATLYCLIYNLCLKGENPTRSCGSRWKGSAEKWWSWWS